MYRAALLALLVVVTGCHGQPDPCSPAGIAVTKRTLGAGVIAAGRCDHEPLDRCLALTDAQAVHEAHRAACRSAGNAELH